MIRSKGCRMRVDATPPDMPATKCSYLTWLKTVIFRLGDAPPDDFIVVISWLELSFLDVYCRTDESFWFWLRLFVTSSSISHTLAPVVTKYTSDTRIKNLTQLPSRTNYSQIDDDHLSRGTTIQNNISYTCVARRPTWEPQQSRDDQTQITRFHRPSQTSQTVVNLEVIPRKREGYSSTGTSEPKWNREWDYAASNEIWV